MQDMAIHPGVEPNTDRLEVLESVRPRLSELGDAAAVDRAIDEALDELFPANVTTYLPILVERKVRERLRPRSATPAS
jgi:hypothetical protein